MLILTYARGTQIAFTKRKKETFRIIRFAAQNCSLVNGCGHAYLRKAFASELIYIYSGKNVKEREQSGGAASLKGPSSPHRRGTGTKTTTANIVQLYY